MSIKKAYTSHSILMVSIAFKNCFQFMLSLGLIPLILKINRSKEFIKSVKVLLPLKTLVIYFPSGYARSTVARKISITPKISRVIESEFFGFDQYIEQVYKHCN